MRGDARFQAVLYDFLHWTLVTFLIALLPALEDLAASDLTQFDWRKFVAAVIAALIMGVIGAIRKLVAPQLVSVDGQSVTGQPTIVGVSLKDVSPAPAKVDQVQQQRPDARLLDTIGAEKTEL